jgi:hypothetical protein
MIGKKTLISFTTAIFFTVSYRHFINTGKIEKFNIDNTETSSRNLKSLSIFVCVFVLSYFAQVLILNNGMSNAERNSPLSYARTQTEVINMLDSVEIGYAPF